MRGPIACSFALACGLLCTGAAHAADLVDGIAAQVGTDVVLISEVNRLSAPMVERFRAAGATDRDIAMVQSDALESLIERRLIAIFAQRAEIDASDAEIDQAVAAIAADNKISVDTLKKSVEGQGLSFEAYRQRLREEIVHQKVVSGMVRSKVEVDEAEVRALYQQRYAEQPQGGQELHLQDLVVAAQDDKPASLQAACQNVRAAERRLDAGEPFLEVATQTSQADPEVGWVYRQSLAPWMLKVVDQLEPGSRSGVVELPFGCAILKLLAVRDFQPVSYEEAKPKLQAEIFEQRFQEQYRTFIDSLREKTYIERKGVFAEAARLDIRAAEGQGEEKPPR
jgi:peptidyl-prolyl cis-trans isomerase SurA